MNKELSEILDKTVERIIKTCNPLKIILFGSAAKDNMSYNSDLDFLVIMKNGIHRRKTAQSIYKNISDIGFASDIIVITEEDVELYAKNDQTIIKPALQEGKVLYAA